MNTQTQTVTNAALTTATRDLIELSQKVGDGTLDAETLINYALYIETGTNEIAACIRPDSVTDNALLLAEQYYVDEDVAERFAAYALSNLDIECDDCPVVDVEEDHFVDDSFMGEFIFQYSKHGSIYDALPGEFTVTHY